MSEHEFDNYLTLLTKLLRLDGRQRDAIAGELRAHLEEQLDELLARGVPREEAIRLALEDFGDAAGLAAQFGSLSRNRRRRWLMRMTTFSVAATVLIAAGLAIFWPGRNAGPGVAEVAAQDPDEAKPAAKPADPTGPGDTKPQAVKPLEAMLEQRIDAEFEETPLRDVLKFVEDNSGIQFYVQQKKLDEAGLDLDIPITKHLRRVRISTLLDLMLADVELVYYDKDDLIVITTQEEAESFLEIRVYDCRDLLGLPPNGGLEKPMLPPAAAPAVGLPVPGTLGIPGLAPPEAGAGSISGGQVLPPSPRLRPGKEIMPQFGGGGMGGGMGDGGGNTGRPALMTEEQKRVHSLIMLITTNVDPQNWDEVGGPGSISEYHGLIVVTQTAQTHKKLERVLDMLREAAGLEVGESKKVVR